MGSVNKVILVGNVGKDPEIRSLNNGDRVASLSLATTESWRDKSSGEKKEKTEWHRVVVFNDGLVKVIENYVKKGTTLYLEGALQTRKYEKDGQERYVTEVVLQRFGGQLVLLGGGERGEARQQDVNPPRQAAPKYDDGINDDIPF